MHIHRSGFLRLAFLFIIFDITSHTVTTVGRTTMNTIPDTIETTVVGSSQQPHRGFHT